MIRRALALLTTQALLFAIFTEGHFLPNIQCSLQPAVVATNHNTLPYFVSLKRCKGSAFGNVSPKEVNHRCVAATKEVIHLKAYNIVTHKKESVIVANHTSCRSECALTASDCKKPAYLSNCECKCPHRYMQCGPKKSWSRNKCTCQCNVSNRNCPFGKEFDEETCQCICKRSRVQKCLSRGGKFNFTRCKCSRRRHSTSRGNDILGGSNTFWICAVVGEFVILCLIFELVLYYKDHGLIHKLSRHCKAHRKSKNTIDTGSEKSESNGRVTDEEDRYVYF